MPFQIKYNKFKLGERFPYANASIIFICAAIYIVPALTGGIHFFQYLISGDAPLYNSIENKFDFIPGLILHQPWRIITSGFLHANLLHIVLNMWALAVIGIPLERIFGKGRFICIYILSIIGSSLFIIIFSSVFSKNGLSWLTPTVGASGGIFGLLGAIFFVVKKLKAPTANITGTVFLNLVISFSVPNISWQGHLGGLVIGGLIGWIFTELPYNKQKSFSIIYSSAIGIVLLVITFACIIISKLPNF